MKHCRKTRWRYQEDAIRALHHLQNISRREVKPCRVYHCPRCNGFHLTSQEVWV